MLHYMKISEVIPIIIQLLPVTITMSSLFHQPMHIYIYVMNEGFKAEINAMMDVIMSAISNFKPTTFFLNFCSKVAYMHTY